MGAFTCAEIQGKVTALKTLISTYEEASLQLATGTIQSYTFDTGQTRQTVTKFDVEKLDELIDGLYNRLAMLCARYPECTGSGSGAGIAGPNW